MDKEMTIKEWQTKFEAGEFVPYNPYSTRAGYWSDVGWYDWFCPTSQLLRRTNKLGKIVAKFKDGGKLDLNNQYVWFKNNCPLTGPYYDDIRIADMETGDCLMTIQVDCPYSDSKYTVYRRGDRKWTEIDTDKPSFKTNSLPQLIKWLSAKEEQSKQ